MNLRFSAQNTPDLQDRAPTSLRGYPPTDAGNNHLLADYRTAKQLGLPVLAAMWE